MWTELTRRDLLQRGLGAAAALAVPRDQGRPQAPHFAPRARRLLFVFLGGGLSHLESFDPKPRLRQDHGKPWRDQFLLGPRYEFQRYGQCGLEVSELFPHLGRCADELCVVRSMTADHGNHYEATLSMHTGSTSFARPSLGAWLSWALGSDNRNLPGFVVIAPKLPYAGALTWGSDFLPACHQGVRIIPGATPLVDLTPRQAPELQALELERLRALDQAHAAARGNDAQLVGRVDALETAIGMQAAAPAVFDLRHESDATLRRYGLPRGRSDGYAWQCLVARRLLERGVRVVELMDVGASNNWDAHGDMQSHEPLARAIDQPLCGLLRDLRSRGLLEDTLVVFATEFGRAPFGKKDEKGRGHHARAFTCWLAGAGVRAGTVVGASDDLGLEVAQDRVGIHDFHATVLHLMGLDHQRLTFRHGGRDYRLTDTGGVVARKILA